MAPSPLQLAAVNHSGDPASLTIHAQPGTDILYLRSSPDGSVPTYLFNSPIYKVSMRAAAFRRARVTITSPTGYPLPFDQAGLLFLRPHPNLPEPTADNPGDAETFPGFAKVALETFQGTTFCTVSAAQRALSEWSMWPAPADFEKTHTAILEVGRVGPYLSASLVHGGENDGEEETTKKSSSLFRVVPWCFENVKSDEPDVWIGVYAARPSVSQEGEQDFTVHFSDFEIETEDGIVRFA